MNISDNGINEIKNREGIRLVAYKDSVGIPTIGVGTIQYPTGLPVRMGDKCTTQQALGYFKHDLARFEKAVNTAVKVPMTQNQYDAMVSLAYNIGTAGFMASSVVKRLNKGDVQGAAEAFLMWNKAGGKAVTGLTNRRQSEKLQFLGA